MDKYYSYYKKYIINSLKVNNIFLKLYCLFLNKIETNLIYQAFSELNSSFTIVQAMIIQDSKYLPIKESLSKGKHKSLKIATFPPLEPCVNQITLKIFSLEKTNDSLLPSFSNHIFEVFIDVKPDEEIIFQGVKSNSQEVIDHMLFNNSILQNNILNEPISISIDLLKPPFS